MISSLVIKVNLTEEDLIQQYDDFTNSYPEGKISKEEFKEVFGEKGAFPNDSLFRVFDEDNSGTIDFAEFMLASNCTNLPLPEEKISWIFNVFDEDGGGSIDADEVEKVVHSLLKMTGSTAGQEEISDCVNMILKAVDKDGDGDISKEEFVGNALKIDFISNILA